MNVPILLSLAALAALPVTAHAQTGAPPMVPLYDTAALTAQDLAAYQLYRAPAEKANGAGCVVCPGGGYGVLAPHEGEPVAKWLNSIGVTAIVLKYRLGPKYHHPTELHDAQRALRTMRAHAKEWSVDPARVGIIGFSAGGHLASTAATHFDDGNPASSDTVERQGCRPDFAILVYPVITLEAPYTHAGSRTNLLGPNPAPELVELLSNEKQVTPRTPPVFLVHGADDTVVPVQNSLMFASACAAKRVPFELHVFAHGPHGFGLGGNDPVLSQWPALCAAWLRARGLLKG